MAAERLIVAEHVNHHYGAASLRKQILFDVNVEIGSGEIVIVTGPSGSGKTTLLTLIGGLRATQDGSLRVLGHELRDAREAELVRIRRSIGYIFQAHNLLDALTARQNVQMALQLHRNGTARHARARAYAALAAVGLAAHADAHPDQLSGGQRQRVAIARALASAPRMILADEPTASLDRQSGREVVDIMQRIAREQGCTIVLVTHDYRILDIADRILHLEDGRLASFTDAVLSNTRQLMGMLAQNTRKGELVRRMEALPVAEFTMLMETVTREFQQFLHLLEMSQSDAFDSMLEQVIEAFTLRVGSILDAERATLFLVDREREELWSKVAETDGAKALDIRIPLAAGLAGQVARTGESVNVEDAYQAPGFNPEVDRRTGYRTASLLCVPIRDSQGQVFAVAQLLNKRGAARFDATDEQRLRELSGPLGVLLESWWRMGQHVRARG